MKLLLVHQALQRLLILNGLAVARGNQVAADAQAGIVNNHHPRRSAQAGGFKRAEATDAEIVDDKGKPAAAAAKPAQQAPAAQEAGKPADDQPSAEALKAQADAKRDELKKKQAEEERKNHKTKPSSGEGTES